LPGERTAAAWAATQIKDFESLAVAEKKLCVFTFFLKEIKHFVENK